MLKGIDFFKEHFAGYEDNYVVIGGTACYLIMNDVGIRFRATKDIDMIILMESQSDDFIKKFWEYINLGGYNNRAKSSGELRFYRFDSPDKPNFPDMIELFSKHPPYNLEEETHLVPLHFSDDISSLSAILLDDNYYDFMRQGRKQVQGVSVLDAEYLIPFKTKAYLDLQSRKSEGASIDEKNIKKHKYDVYRLFALLSPAGHIVLPESIKNDMENFLSSVSNDQINLKQLIGLNIELNDLLNILRKYYLE